MLKPLKILTVLFCFLSAFVTTELQAQSTIPGQAAEGRWDITIQTPEGTKPAWLEIETSGVSALVGRYVGPSGSARPISQIHYSENNNRYSFTIPPQWTQREDPHFEFTLHDGRLSGWTTAPNGDTLRWSGDRAPDLIREKQPEWGDPIELIDGNLSKWILAEGNRFRVEDGILVNRAGGKNLITKRNFDDFKLHIEFRYPEGSNSGVYLRGRYEVQIYDNYGMDPESHLIGGVYGFIDPIANPAKKAGEWQSFDITLVGRVVSVTFNGVQVICKSPIPGITGGALDSKEGQPGPIMLQGDHGPVEFRNITVTPALDR